MPVHHEPWALVANCCLSVLYKVALPLLSHQAHAHCRRCSLRGRSIWTPLLGGHRADARYLPLSPRILGLVTLTLNPLPSAMGEGQEVQDGCSRKE
jgi:hypothetical protein